MVFIDQFFYVIIKKDGKKKKRCNKFYSKDLEKKKSKPEISSFEYLFKFPIMSHFTIKFAIFLGSFSRLFLSQSIKHFLILTGYFSKVADKGCCRFLWHGWVLACFRLRIVKVFSFPPNYDIYIYIYIYIFTNLLSTSIHGTRKKKRKKTRQEQEIKVSRITARGKKKKIIGQRERKGQPRPTPWKKSKDTQSVGQKKTKNLPRILQCYNYS